MSLETGDQRRGVLDLSFNRLGVGDGKARERQRWGVPSVDCVLGWVLGTQGEQNQLGFGAQLLVSVDRLSDSSSRDSHLLLD